MREIKFRVWDNLANFYWGEGEGMDFKKIAFNFYDSLFKKNELTFQQYIGLKDKTGKDIYEGDIVRYVEKMDCHGDSQVLTATVIYDNDYGAWGLGKEEIHNYFLDLTVLKNTVEVLGNIFENKELLK